MRFVWTTREHLDWEAMIAAIKAPEFIATHVRTMGFEFPDARPVTKVTYDADDLSDEELGELQVVVDRCISLVKYMRVHWVRNVCDAFADYADTEFRPDFQIIDLGPVMSFVFDTESDGGPESGYLEEYGIFQKGGFFQ